MNKIKFGLIAGAAAVLAFGVAACGQTTTTTEDAPTAESVGESMESSMESAVDAAGEAAEETGEAMENAAEETGEAMENATDGH